MSDSDSDDISLPCTPPELRSVVNVALSGLIPEKSKNQYEKCYTEFKNWCDRQKVAKISENILLAYLLQKSKMVKSSTLWSIYSMLKCMLNVREGVDIKQFSKLVPFLKRKSVGYQAKKSKILTRQQIDLFLREADDETYLLLKVKLKRVTVFFI